MRLQMEIECVDCGDVRRKWVPVRFHYSDGCYTVLAIDEQRCERCTPVKS